MTEGEYEKFKESMERFRKEESEALSDVENDYNDYKILLELWKSENPIKTNKLQVLLVVNGLLISAMQVAGGFVPDNWAIYVAGAAFSLVWVLSIGRTSLYQKYWQKKIEALSEAHSDDARFKILNIDDVKKTSPRWLKILGGVSSKYYLLGAPIMFSLFWVAALIFSYCQTNANFEETKKAMNESSFSCPARTEVKIERWEDIGFSRTCVNMNHGKWEAWKDGYRKISGYYEKGKKHGVWEYYSSDGIISNKLNYINGKQQ